MLQRVIPLPGQPVKGASGRRDTEYFSPRSLTLFKPSFGARAAILEIKIEAGWIQAELFGPVDSLLKMAGITLHRKFLFQFISLASR